MLDLQEGILEIFADAQASESCRVWGAVSGWIEWKHDRNRTKQAAWRAKPGNLEKKRAQMREYRRKQYEASLTAEQRVRLQAKRARKAAK